MGANRTVNRSSIGKPEGKRPIGRPKHGQKIYIKLDIKKT
jgi:hypothetical protein